MTTSLAASQSQDKHSTTDTLRSLQQLSSRKHFAESIPLQYLPDPDYYA